eukprot:15210371-Heterocapsa_arctica.AAC.1
MIQLRPDIRIGLVDLGREQRLLHRWIERASQSEEHGVPAEQELLDLVVNHGHVNQVLDVEYSACLLSLSVRS